jgi:hypothetical protein
MKMLRGPESASPEAARAADEETQQLVTTPALPSARPAGFAVVDRDLASRGQLVSFSRFSRKDPFSPQIREDSDSARSAKRTPSRGAAAEKGRAQRGKEARVRVAGRPRGAGSARNAAPRARREQATSAVISVNGVREEVRVGAAFPAAEKAFRLVSLGEGGARIGVAGGSLVGGSQTVVLERGKTLTLMNTADGARFVLRLVSVG